MRSWRMRVWGAVTPPPPAPEVGPRDWGGGAGAGPGHLLFLGMVGLIWCFPIDFLRMQDIPEEVESSQELKEGDGGSSDS